MSTALFNIVRMTTPSTGTGVITLGSAVPGFNSFSAAGVPNAARVSYGISDGGNSEVGRGTYNSAAGTVSRDTILASTNGGAAINLSGNAQIGLTPLAQDIVVQTDYATRAAASADNINPNAAFVRTAGYATAGDFGAASYVRSGSLVAGGFQSADGAFWTVVNDIVTPQMFGAKGDGTTDDTAAFQLAINTKRRVNVPYVGTPGGTTGYLIAGTLTMNPGCHISGEKQVILNCTSLACFAISPFVTNFPEIVVENFQIDMAGAPVSSAAIQFKSSLGTVFRVRIRNNRFTNCFAALQQDAASVNPLTDILTTDCLCYFTRGTQINFNNTAGFIVFWRFEIDNTLNTSDVTWVSAEFANFAGLELHLFDILGVASRTNYTSVPAIQIQVGSALWLDRVLVDNTENNGILVGFVDDIDIVSSKTFNNLGYGQYYLNCTRIQGSLLVNVGNKGTARDGASQNISGIIFDNCTSVQLATIRSEFAGSATGGGGAGVLLENGTTYLTATNIRCINCAGAGWAETDTCNFNIKSQAVINGNLGSSIVQVGASSAFLNYIPQNGTFVASTVGAATVA